MAKSIPLVRSTLPTKLLHVGTRGCILQSATNGTNSQINSYSKHWIPVACRNLRLGWGNWAVDTLPSTGERDGPAAYTKFCAGLEKGWFTGSVQRLTFGGQAFPAVDPGGIVISDPAGLHLAAGSTIGARVHMEMAAPTAYYIGGTSVSSGLNEGVEIGTALTDKSVSGAISGSTAQNLGPTLILGEPDNPNMRSVAIVGDSIPSGTGDTVDSTTGLIGYIQRGLTNSVPHSKFCRGSDRMSGWITRRYRRMAWITSYFTDVIHQPGVNDANFSGDNASLATMQANFGTMLTDYRAAGLRVSVCTLTPISPDATTRNTNWAVFAAYNDWLRAGVAGVSNLYEAADVVETSRNSGLWKAGYSAGDFVHPSQATSILLASLIKPSDFGY